MADDVAPVPEPVKVEAFKPLRPGELRIKDAQGMVHEFNLNTLDEASGQELFDALPKERQEAALKQKEFIKNFKNSIKDIPPELLKPGALEELFAKLVENQGYATEKFTDAQRQFLDGNWGADLKRNGFYKGFKRADEVTQLASDALGFAGGTVDSFFAILGLPGRAFSVGVDWSQETLSATPEITDGQALAVAAAYQGALYMSTDWSELQKREREPTVADQAVAGFQVGRDNIAVFLMAAWKAVTNFIKEGKWEWSKAWDEAEKSYTDGKGIASYDARVREHIYSGTEPAKRPEVEEALRAAKQVAGVEVAPYFDGGYST